METKKIKKEIYFNKKIVTSFFVLSFIFIFIAIQFYSLVKIALAQTSPATDNVVVTLDVTSGITIANNTLNAVTMSPNLGVSSDSAIGSSSWTVKTNAVNGYSLAVKASASPALVSGVNSFADYPEASVGVPEPWSIASGTKAFGYSAYGTDTATGTWGVAASCGAAGIPSATQNYLGFKTTNKIIATRNGVTPNTGIDTTICFTAAQNAVYAPSGTYTATIIATATTL